MAVSVSRSGGIYITISGDYSQFQRDMQEVKRLANASSADISRTLSGSMSSTAASKTITNLSRSFQQAARSAQAMFADMSRFDDQFRRIGQSVGVAQRDLGYFSNLQQRAFQHQSVKTFENNMRNIQRITGASNAEMNRLSRSLGGTGREFSLAANASRSFKESLATAPVGAFIAAVAGASTVLAKYADDYTILRSKIGTVSNDPSMQNALTDRLFNLANETTTGIGETVSSFVRFNNALKETGKTEEDVLRMTETVNKALYVAGATSAEAASVLLQLSQAFAAGKLQGEEFKAVSKGIPDIMKYIAKVMKVPETALKNLASEGKITSEVLYKAISLMEKPVDDAYAKMAITIGQSFTSLGNDITQTVGEIDQALGISTTVGEKIRSLGTDIKGASEGLGTFVKYADNAAVALTAYGLVAWKGTAAIGAMKAGWIASSTAVGSHITLMQMVTARYGKWVAATTLYTSAVKTMGGALSALARSPFVWTIAATGALYALWESMREGEARTKDLMESFERWEERMGKVAEKTKEASDSLAADRVRKAEIALNDLRAAQSQMASFFDASGPVLSVDTIASRYNLSAATSTFSLGNPFKPIVAMVEGIDEEAKKGAIHLRDMALEASKVAEVGNRLNSMVTTLEKITKIDLPDISPTQAKLNIAKATLDEIETLVLKNPASQALRKMQEAAQLTIGELNKTREAEEELAKAEGMLKLGERAQKVSKSIQQLDELMAKLAERSAMPKDSASAYEWLVKWTQGTDAAKKAQWELEKATANVSLALLAQGAAMAFAQQRFEDFATIMGQVKGFQAQVNEKVAAGLKLGGKRGGGGVDERERYRLQTVKQIADLEHNIRYAKLEQLGTSQAELSVLKMEYEHRRRLEEMQEAADKAKMLGSNEYQNLVRLTKELHGVEMKVAQFEAAWAGPLAEMQHAVDLASALGQSTEKATLTLKELELSKAQSADAPGFGTLMHTRDIEKRQAEIQRLNDEINESLFADTRDYLIYSEEMQQREMQRIHETYAKIKEMQDRGLIGEETAALARQRLWAEEQGGTIAGVQRYYDSIQSMSKAMEDATINAFQSVEDYFVNMITKLEFDFSALADSIVADMARIVVQQSIMKPLSKGFFDFFGIENAHGNVYAAGSGLAQYRNSVISTPTLFTFAAGGVPGFGLMGEKMGSPGEAIMPLTRVGGDLGVKATIAQPQAPAITVNVYEAPGTKATVRQSEDGSSIDVLVEMLANKMQNRIDRGAMQGLQRKKAYI